MLLVFMSKCSFKLPKDIKLNATFCFIIKIFNKKEIQQIASNHSSDTEFKDFVKPYKDYTKEPFSFLVKDKSLPLNNLLRYRNNLL